MPKIIPYSKLSKKAKRKLDLAKRQTWGQLCPVTRKPESSKAYNRNKAQGWKKDLSSPAFFAGYQWLEFEQDAASARRLFASTIGQIIQNRRCMR